MKSNTALLWEKSLYLPGPSGWERLVAAKPEDTPMLISQRVRPGTSMRLVYEAASVETEVVDVPTQADRGIVALTLADSHASLANATTPWGYQTPWANGSNHSTFLTLEEPPFLYDLRETVRPSRVTLTQAYPFISLALAAGFTRGVNTVFAVVEGTDQIFLAFFLASGLRACTKLSRKSPDFDLWTEARLVFMEYGINVEQPVTDGLHTSVRIYQMPGTDVKETCPYWAVFNTHCKIEVAGLDALVALANGISSRDPGSLTSSFPKVVNLTPVVQGLAVLLAFGIGFLGWVFYQEQTKLSIARSRTLADTSATEARIKHLNDNKNRIENYRRLAADDAVLGGRANVRFLGQLGDLVPVHYSTTALSLDRTGKVSLSAVYWDTKAEAGKSGAPAGPNNSQALGKQFADPIVAALERSALGVKVAPEQTSADAVRNLVRVEGTFTPPTSNPSLTPSSAPAGAVKPAPRRP